MYTFDPFSSVFPFLGSLCAPLNSKYNLPIKHEGRDGWWHTIVTPELYADWCEVEKQTREWLKTNYALECDKYLGSTFKNWVGGGRERPPRVPGLDAYLSDETRPSPHYGWPGAQNSWEISYVGRIQMAVMALCSAYSIVVAGRYKDEAERAAKKAKLEEWKRKNAIEAAYREKALAEWKKKKVARKAAEREAAIKCKVRRRLAKIEFDAEVERCIHKHIEAERRVTGGGSAAAPAPSNISPFPNVVEIAE